MQLHFRSQKRNTFLSLFAFLSLFLSILPFLVAFNEGLTKIIEATYLYRFIQATIVPYEVKIVAGILHLINIPVLVQADGLTVHSTFMRVTWNCLGWQSILFLILSFSVGLQRTYTFVSIVETVIIGILGTFLMNIARIFFIVFLGVYLPSIFAIVFHDYFATLVTAGWLFVFWRFSYSFVLEDKTRE